MATTTSAIAAIRKGRESVTMAPEPKPRTREEQILGLEFLLREFPDHAQAEEGREELDALREGS